MSEQPSYPDILGELADERLTIGEVVQCALGVFPDRVALGQPLEALLLLQNLTNQPLPLELAVRSSSRDAAGNLANFLTPKPRIALALPGGEVALMHIPITAQLPTLPSADYAVRIQIKARKPDTLLRVRPLIGGQPPSLLAISPFRLAVLRDIAFKAKEVGPDQLEALFAVLKGRFPPPEREPKPRYEALWTLRDYEQEEEQVQAIAGEAMGFARTLGRHNVYAPLVNHTQEFFAGAGMPLHPGEAVFIAKVLTYVMEDGLDLEEGFSRADSHWFRRLRGLMVQDRDVIHHTDRLLRLLYTAIVQDAALLGFIMVTHVTRVNFGDDQERADYASRLVAALEGRMPVALEHVYVPLALAGTLLLARMTSQGENPWESLDDLIEARDGRISLAGSAFREVFDILNQLIEKAERLLTELRIPRK